MNKWKKLSIVGITLMSAILLTACGNSNASKSVSSSSGQSSQTQDNSSQNTQTQNNSSQDTQTQSNSLQQVTTEYQKQLQIATTDVSSEMIMVNTALSSGTGTNVDGVDTSVPKEVLVSTLNSLKSSEDRVNAIINKYQPLGVDVSQAQNLINTLEQAKIQLQEKVSSSN